MLKNLATIICAIAVFIIVKYGLKKNPTELSKTAFLKMIGYFGSINYTIHEKNIQKSMITKEETFAKSKTYRLIETMLFDLDLKDTTVEGFIFGILFFSFIINVVLFFYTLSIFMFIILYIGLTIFLFVLAYMLSNKGHFEREYAIMSAEDLISVNLTTGIYKAIKNNMGLFDEKIRMHFEEFVSNIDDYKMSFNQSLDILTDRLGSSFIKFSAKLKEYERTGKQSTLETFKDDIDLNVMRRTEMMELEEVLNNNNMTYIQTLSITGFLLVVFCASTPQLLLMLVTTLLGRILLIASLSLVLGGFTYLQTLRN